MKLAIFIVLMTLHTVCYATKLDTEQIKFLLSKPSELDNEGNLPFIPPGLSSVSELRRLPTAQHAAKKHGLKYTKNHITNELRTNIELAHLTDTYLNCYISPPAKTFVSMDDLMGFWYLVRKVNSTKYTDARYVCEEVIYIPTGLNTFNKIADVHYKGKWFTIHGNGTFISPGIVIIDWRVLNNIQKPDRLVFTVLGTDYSQYVVGYDCHTGKHKPEVVIQTRSRSVKLKYLEQAYAIVKDDKLPLDDLVCELGF